MFEYEIFEEDVDSLSEIQSELEDGKELREYEEVLSFSTENANYYLYGGDHCTISKTSHIISESDGIVLESNHYREEVFDSFVGDQYSEIMYDNMEYFKKPVYVVDVESPVDWDPNLEGDNFKELYESLKDDELFQSFENQLKYGLLSTFGVGAVQTFLGNPEFSVLCMPLIGLKLGSKKNKLLKNIGAYTQLSSFYLPIMGGRSALSAEKIDEFVAPKIGKDIGRKPDIYIEYGEGHMDIKPYLKHKKLRKTVMGIHSTFDYRPHGNKYQDKVCEVKFRDFEERSSRILVRDRDTELDFRHSIYSIPGISEPEYGDLPFGDVQKLLHKGIEKGVEIVSNLLE